MKLEVIHEAPKCQPHATPLIFVHGKWHAAWCWAEHFLPYFAEHGYISYALSLRGHGESEGHERLRWTSIADYVADVTQVADLMNTSPVIIGHSMGGFVTQKYLEIHPAPAAVLLTSLPPSGLRSGMWRSSAAIPGSSWRPLSPSVSPRRSEPLRWRENSCSQRKCPRKK